MTELFLAQLTKARENGITQVDLSNMNKIEPRKTFHHLKILHRSDLLVKVPVVFKKARTNLWIHQQFAEKSIRYTEYINAKDNKLSIRLNSKFDGKSSPRNFFLSTIDMAEKMTSLLSTATNNTLVLYEMMVAMNIDINIREARKLFYKVVNFLQNVF